MQMYTSKDTSLNQVPALHKKVAKELGKVNFDNGAGKYNKATEYLAGYGVTNICYDKYNRTKEENDKALNHGKCDTSTIANVLNVLDNEQTMIEVLQLSKKMLKPNGKVYISVYEGNKTGIGKQSKKDCYQQNKRTKDYIPTIKKVFNNTTIRHNIIVAW